jgi:hypothetical protein
LAAAVVLIAVGAIASSLPALGAGLAAAMLTLVLARVAREVGPASTVPAQLARIETAHGLALRPKPSLSPADAALEVLLDLQPRRGMSRDERLAEMIPTLSAAERSTLLADADRARLRAGELATSLHELPFDEREAFQALFATTVAQLHDEFPAYGEEPLRHALNQALHYLLRG